MKSPTFLDVTSENNYKKIIVYNFSQKSNSNNVSFYPEIIKCNTFTPST